MGGYEYLADGHHVDDAGNLIACTYVDLRDPTERFPITALRKASSKRHAMPGCETVRISKPACFLDQGEGIGGGESHHSANGWIYCASIEPETAEERAAWGAAMPAGRGAVSPICRPRAFARALGAMVAEQAGPRGRIVLLRTVEGRSFRTHHKSQTIYHGPVVYADDPVRRVKQASSDLELLLLLVFLKDAAHRAQREYRFAVWAEDEPAEDVLDLDVSPALADATSRPRPKPDKQRIHAGRRGGVLGGRGRGQRRSFGTSRACRDAAGLHPAPATRPWCHSPRTSRGCRTTCARRRRPARRSMRCEKRSSGRTRAAPRPPPRRGTPNPWCGSSARRSTAGSPACA